MNTVGNQGLRLGKKADHNLQSTQNGVDHHTHPSAALGGLLHLRRDFRFVGIGIRGGVHGTYSVAFSIRLLAISLYGKLNASLKMMRFSDRHSGFFRQAFSNDIRLF